MKTRQLLPALARLDLAHERAALIAQLALCSTFPAEAIETIRELLDQFPAGQVANGLERASADFVEQGRGPEFPYGDDAHSYMLLLTGLRRLERLGQPAALVSYSLLAAA